MNALPGSYPILSCDEARALEARVLGGDEAKEWAAMQEAGRAIAAAVGGDFDEIGGFPPRARVLVLVGKGHNGGDAIIAAQALLEKYPVATADVLFAFGAPGLRPLADRAWRQLVGAAPDRVRQVGRLEPAATYDLGLDGIFGFQFRPPAEARIAALIAAVNAQPIRLRAAVDLPSAGLFRADFTYATGSVKTPVLGAPEAGRVRFLDLGFFGPVAGVASREPGRTAGPGSDRVLTAEVLSPLTGLRAPQSDKRSYGHLFIVGGSRSYPGAVLMSALAAIRSGAGLVTVFAPESMVPAFAARAPEAMWVGWPETPSGGLALEGEQLLRERIARASALVLGPGLGREPETLALARSLVEQSTVPMLIDADALQPDIVAAGSAPRIVTPHAGEFARIRGAWEESTHMTLVLKGTVTRIEGRAGLRPASIENAAMPQGGSQTRPAEGASPIYH